MCSNIQYILLDVDTGVDDAWGIWYLLQMEQKFNYQVLGITCSRGNGSTADVARNTLRILEVANRLDIPVYRGCYTNIIRNEPENVNITDDFYYGKDGFGDFEFATEPDLSLIQSENGVQAMHRIILEKPKQVTLICFAPLTNVAVAMTMFDDFSENVKDIFILGGNYKAHGNSPMRTAEYNFYIDPEAANMVLNKAKCPIKLLAIEASDERNFNLSIDWRFNVLGAVENDFIRFINPVEEHIFGPRDFINWPIYDALLVLAIFHPNEAIISSSEYNAAVELQGFYTRGQVAIDRLGETEPNCTIIQKLDANIIKELFLTLI